MADLNSVPPYPKPKVLLVDLPVEATQRLTSAGFNVQSGTFGRPSIVLKTDKIFQVIDQSHLPNHREQEVIIVDLTPPVPTHNFEDTDELVEGQQDWYAKGSRGVIDPRPKAMCLVSDDWNRILQSGGAFVVFAQPRLYQELVFAKIRHRNVVGAEAISHDNWSFLPIVSSQNFRVELDDGTESQVLKSFDFLEKFLRSHQTGLKFNAVLTPMFSATFHGSQFEFLPLLENKYGQTVGGIIFAKRPGKGGILILPQFEDKVRAVSELITTIRPRSSDLRATSPAGLAGQPLLPGAR